MKKKSEILRDLYYNKGKQGTNFRIFHNYMEKGQKMFSKWVYYLDATIDDIKKATHRTLLINEVVLDFDPNPSESFEDLTIRVKNVCKDLWFKRMDYVCYYTGSRGYHVHLYLKRMFFMNKENRRSFRVNIARFYGSELQKNSEGTGIALENVPHWKSGKKKERCDF